MTVSELLECQTTQELNTKVFRSLDAQRLMGIERPNLVLNNDTGCKEFDGCSLGYLTKTDTRVQHVVPVPIIAFDNDSEIIRIPKFIKRADINGSVKHITGYGRDYVENCTVCVGDNSNYGDRKDLLSIDIKSKVNLFTHYKYDEFIVKGYDEDKASLLCINDTSLNGFGVTKISGKVMVCGQRLVNATPTIGSVLHKILKKYNKVRSETIKYFGIGDDVIYVTWTKKRGNDKEQEHFEICGEEALDKILINDRFIKDTNKNVLYNVEYI